jgi:hypothetical protein
MRKSDRPGYFARSRSRAYFQRLEAIAKLKVIDGMTEAEARAFLRDKVKHYRDKTRPWELCLAMNRRGLPCQARALDNGRCRNHGGLSTGPKTEDGRRRSLAGLKQFRR